MAVLIDKICTLLEGFKNTKDLWIMSSLVLEEKNLVFTVSYGANRRNHDSYVFNDKKKKLKIYYERLETFFEFDKEMNNILNSYFGTCKLNTKHNITRSVKAETIKSFETERQYSANETTAEYKEILTLQYPKGLHKIPQRLYKSIDLVITSGEDFVNNYIKLKKEGIPFDGEMHNKRWNIW